MDYWAHYLYTTVVTQNYAALKLINKSIVIMFLKKYILFLIVKSTIWSLLNYILS